MDPLLRLARPVKAAVVVVPVIIEFTEAKPALGSMLKLIP